MKTVVEMRAMHRVRMDVPTADGRLLENVYETYELVTKRWLIGNVTVWRCTTEANVQRLPIYELISKAIGGHYHEEPKPELLSAACNGCGNVFSCMYPDCPHGR